MTVKTLLGCLLALVIGVICRLTGIPLPAPMALLGGLLVMAMTIGYSWVDCRLDRAASGMPGSGGRTGGEASP